MCVVLFQFSKLNFMCASTHNFHKSLQSFFISSSNIFRRTLLSQILTHLFHYNQTKTEEKEENAESGK